MEIIVEKKLLEKENKIMSRDVAFLNFGSNYSITWKGPIEKPLEISVTIELDGEEMNKYKDSEELPPSLQKFSVDNEKIIKFWNPHILFQLRWMGYS